ncbi:glycosyltransferase [Arthrobacter glacialis]|uniref:Glycosyl transferase n=1 Tax=Arthrobacter glacialis TaxID=1664 RepID=A0A2S3ZZ93_ARTGL|nr:glycosyltransferase [Arthrobacter glacialis]POH58457.1 glycosyl transferase [Arthrobacter glacialis]POH74606.1 glycosyl transferase [Arthrobacter glacialis]
MPLDIFIPYWGDPGYMEATVRSVVAQDCDDWELTIIDDAYPDRAIERFVAELAHPRITYIRKEHNEGITANYRSCVALAKQEMIVILGCDDIIHPNYVSTILAGHERFPEASIIQPGVIVIDEDGRTVNTLVDTVKQRCVKPRSNSRQLLSGESLATNLMHGVWLYWPSLAFRTEKIREVDFREGYPIIQDVALTMDMIYQGAQILVEPTVCFSYRRHSASASSAKLVDGSRFAGEREYFAFAASQAEELGWTRTKRAAKLRLTSRAHALALLPRAAMTRHTVAMKALARHAFGS